MSLQTNILKDYRSLFPQDTLREISNRTGIQLTRVFRLLNGSPMKLAEYESFYDLIELENTKSENISALKLLRSHGHKLSGSEMSKIHDFIQRKIQFNELVTSQQIISIQKQELA